MKKVFIDGNAGTTGLRIYDRLKERDDIKLFVLPDEKRKDPESIKDAICGSDITFLCLPDAAAVEAVSFAENAGTVIIDTSTAHRTAPGWAYGFPELSDNFKKEIQNSNRIAVPGCHASGFVSLIYPLIEADILPTDASLSCFSLTGYSGGGKKMISQYESGDFDPLLKAPRQYGFSQEHKHLKEMKEITGIGSFPIFSPIVDDYYSGMQVTVPLFKNQLKAGKTVEDIRSCFKAKYSGEIVKYSENIGGDGFLSAAEFSNKDSMAVSVFGNADRIILTCVFDNLGKGSSGAAIECLNLVLGTDIKKGLIL